MKRCGSSAIAEMKSRESQAVYGRSFGYASKAPADKVKWFHGGDDHASQYSTRTRVSGPWKKLSKFQNS